MPFQSCFAWLLAVPIATAAQCYRGNSVIPATIPGLLGYRNESHDCLTWRSRNHDTDYVPACLEACNPLRLGKLCSIISRHCDQAKPYDVTGQ